MECEAPAKVQASSYMGVSLVAVFGMDSSDCLEVEKYPEFENKDALKSTLFCLTYQPADLMQKPGLSEWYYRWYRSLESIQ